MHCRCHACFRIDGLSGVCARCIADYLSARRGCIAHVKSDSLLRSNCFFFFFLLNRAFIKRSSKKSALSALHGVPDRPFQPRCPYQLPGEHCRGAVITNDASLYHTAYSRILVSHMSWVRKCI